MRLVFVLNMSSSLNKDIIIIIILTFVCVFFFQDVIPALQQVSSPGLGHQILLARNQNHSLEITSDEENK